MGEQSRKQFERWPRQLMTARKQSAAAAAVAAGSRLLKSERLEDRLSFRLAADVSRIDWTKQVGGGKTNQSSNRISSSCRLLEELRPSRHRLAILALCFVLVYMQLLLLLLLAEQPSVEAHSAFANSSDADVITVKIGKFLSGDNSFKWSP